MSFGDFLAWPSGLPILFLAPVVWLALRALEHVRARRTRRAVGPRLGVLAADFDAGQRSVRRWLMASGLLMGLVALLQPLWGEGVRRIDQRGIDLLVCLDVSRSMLARDLTPNRLERAHADIRALSEHVRGDRMGLVVFAGEARLSVPLTQDMGSFANLVDQADPLSVERGGTDLGAALETALDAFEGRSGNHEVVLLVTDGEDLEQRGLRVARACRDRGLLVHCVGYGSPIGSKITIEEGGRETFLRDRAGNEVVTVMDPASLRRVAETTGGVFVRSRSSAKPLVDLYDRQIASMARRAFEEERRRERKNRYQWPLLLAFLLWTIELCLTDRRRP